MGTFRACLASSEAYRVLFRRHAAPWWSDGASRAAFRVDTFGAYPHKARHPRRFGGVLFPACPDVGECPERQRGRTVNPLAMPSQVRVLLPPPLPLASFWPHKRGLGHRSRGRGTVS